MVTIKYILKIILYKPLFNLLIFFVWIVPGHSVGWAIILLTLLVRIGLYPSSAKAIIAQQKMKELAPQMEKIKKEYPNKTEQTRLLLELYKREGVNPASGCLPILIQMPILIVLYYVFISGLSTQRFDLLYSFTPRPETINTLFLGIDLAKPDRFFLPLVAALLQFFQSKQLTPSLPARNDPGAMVSRQMTYLMPIMTYFIAISLPAALPLYWAVTTAFAVFQQYWMERKITNRVKVVVRKKEE